MKFLLIYCSMQEQNVLHVEKIVAQQSYSKIENYAYLMLVALECCFSHYALVFFALFVVAHAPDVAVVFSPLVVLLFFPRVVAEISLLVVVVELSFLNLQILCFVHYCVHDSHGYYLYCCLLPDCAPQF